MRLAVLLLLLTSYTTLAQKSYSVKINFESDKKDSLSLEIDSGIEVKDFMIYPGETLKEGYFTNEYVAFEVFHQKLDGNPPAYSDGFFVNNGKAEITIKVNEKGKPQVITNTEAYLFSEFGSEEFLSETREEFNDFWSFYNKNIHLVGKNDSVTQNMFNLNKKHNIAVAEAIDKQPVSYYNFWRFKNIADNPDIERSTKERILENKFERYANTYEYKLIKDIIYGAEIRVGNTIPSFQATDFINNKSFNPKTLKKPLVIVAWATWCAPCLEKMPTLKTLAQKHPAVEFLFINHDKDLNRAKKYIHDKSLAGVHLNVTTSELPVSLMNRIIPKIFVADSELKVIYNYDLQSDTELTKLSEVLTAQQ